MGRALFETDLHRDDELPLFEGTSESDPGLLLASGVRRAYSRGSLIPSPSEVSIFGVISGQVRLYLQGPRGKELEEDRLGHGRVFLLGTTLDRDDEQLQARTTAKETIVVSIPLSQLLSPDQLHSRIHWLLKVQDQRYAEAQRHLRELAFFRLKERLAHRLAELALKDGCRHHPPSSRTTLRVTRESLAMMIGTRPEEVSRALSSLRDEGLILTRTCSREITLIDVDALQAYGRDDELHGSSH